MNQVAEKLSLSLLPCTNVAVEEATMVIRIFLQHECDLRHFGKQGMDSDTRMAIATRWLTRYSP
jgi:hypothetical protein